MFARIAALVSVGLLVACSEAPPSAGKSTLAVDRTDGVVADGSDAVNVTVTVLDAKGGPLAGMAVALTATGNGNVLSAPVATDAKGVAHGTVRSTVVGAKTIGAQVVGATSATLTQTANVNFVAGAATQLAFAVPPSNAPSGSEITPAVQVAVQDKSGNVVTGATNAITLALAGNGEASLEGTATQPAVAGIATFSGLKISHAGNGYTLTAKADGLASAESKAFDVTTGAGATLAFGLQPQGIAAGQAFAPAVTVVQHDASGNVVTTPADVTLAIQGGPAGATLLGTKTVTSVDGVATFTDLSVDLAGTGATLVATATGYTGATSNPFDVRPSAPDAFLSTLEVTPGSLLADGQATTTVKATVRDRFKNGVPGVGVTLAASGSANTFVPATPSGTTDASGVFTATLASTTAEAKTVSAKVADAFQLAGTVTFTPNAPSATRSGLTLSTNRVRAGDRNGVLLTATVLDEHANPVVGATVSFGSDEVSDHINPTPVATDANGVATLTMLAIKASLHHLVAHVASGPDLTADLTVDPGPVSFEKSTFRGYGRAITADGHALDEFDLTLLDAWENPIPGMAVTFTISGSDNSWDPGTSGSTDLNGRFGAYLTSTRAELKTVTAAAQDGSVFVASDPFVPGEPAIDQTTLKVSKDTALADGSDYITISGTCADAWGNPVANAPIHASADGSANTFDPSTDGRGATISGADGAFEFRLSSTVAGPRRIIVQTDFAAAAVLATFVAGVPSSTTSTFTATPDHLTADGKATTTVLLTALDANGNPVSGAPVTIKVSGSGNTTVPAKASGTTDDKGTFSITLASTRAEAKSVDALVGSLDLSTTATFQPGAPDGTASAIAVGAGPVLADGTQTAAISVAVKDAQGNAVPGQAVTLSASGTGNTLSAATGTSDANGMVTATLASTKAEAKTVTAKIGSIVLTGTTAFVAAPPAKGTSSITVSPATLAADGSAKATVLVTVLDAQGNPVAGHDLALGASGSGNTLTPASGKTDASGTFTATLASTKAEAKTVAATIDGFTLNGAVTFKAGAPSKATSTLATGADNRPADGSATVPVTVTVLDAQGNPVAGQAVTLAASGSGNTITPPSGSTDASGVFTATLASTKAEAKTITATVGAISLTGSATFLAGAPDKAGTTVAVSADNRTADGSTTTSIAVTVLDAHGNPVAAHDVSLSVSGSGNTVTPASGKTDATGVFSATLASTRAEKKTITASVDGFTATNTVTFVPGAPSATTSVVAASPASVVADGSATASIAVSVLDAQGNAVPNHAVSLAAAGTGNTVTPASGKTDATGVFTATLASTKAEAKALTATIDGFTVTGTVTFTAGAAAKATSSLTVGPDNQAADGSATSTITVTVLDARSNPVANHAVTLAASGTRNVLSATAGLTDSNGVFTATLATRKAEAKTVTATIDAFTLTGTATFVAGTVAQGSSLLTTSPSAVTANGTATSTITVTLVDADGNPVPGQDVTLAATGSGNTLGPATGKTGADGTLVATLASTKAEAKAVTATAAGFTLTGQVSFLPGAPSATTSKVTVNPGSLTADGSSKSTIQVLVTDAQGNPVPAHTVTLTVDGSHNTLTPSSGQTDGNGILLATLASTKAETKTVTAVVDAFAVTGSVTFTAGVPDAGHTTVSGSPASLTADGKSKATFTVTVKDVNGNPVPGAPVSFRLSGQGVSLAAASGTTGSDGTATVTATSTKAETKAFEANLGFFAVQTSVTFVPGPPDATTSKLVALGSTSAVADGVQGIAVGAVVLDAQGNPVPGALVSFTTSGSHNTFSPPSATSDSGGLASTILSSTTAETKTVTATVGGFALTLKVTFNPGDPSPLTSSMSASPASVTADGTSASTVTVVVADAQGNLIPGYPVFLNAQGTQNVNLSPMNGNTDGSGVFTSRLTSTIAQTAAVGTNLRGFNLSATVTLVAGPPVAKNSVLNAGPPTVTADGTSTAFISLQLRDVNGNAVSGQDVVLSATGSANTFNRTSGKTDATGSFTATLASTKAEQKNLTASAGTLNLSTSLTFVPGPEDAGTSQLVISPGSVVADGSSQATITVTLLDSQKNPVANDQVFVSLSGSGAFCSTNYGQSGPDGRFSTSCASNVVEKKTVTVQTGSITLTGAINFVAGPADPGKSTLTATSGITADGTSTSSVRIVAVDAYGHDIAGQAVSLASTGSSNTFTPASGTTDGSGVFTATFSSTKAETKTLTATLGSTTLTATVTFVPGPPDPAISGIQADPGSALADGSSAITLYAGAFDSQGNPVPGVSVSFGVSGSGNYLASYGGYTDQNGLVTTTVTSTVAEAKTAYATTNGFNFTTPIRFLSGLPSGTKSSLTAAASTVTAGNSVALYVMVRDASGNPINQEPVSLSSSGSANSISPASGTTDASGNFTAYLSSTTAEQKTITATVGSLSFSIVVTVLPGAPDQATSTITASPTSVTADGTSKTTLTVTSRDAYGNPVPSQSVAISASGSGNTLSPTSGSTNASGVFTATLASTKAETKNLTASIAGTVPVYGSVTFTAGAPVAAKSSISATPTTVSAGNSITIKLTAVDAQGNPVPGASATISSSGSTQNTFSPASGFTDGSGVFTSSFSSTKAEAKTVTVTVGSMSLSTNVTVTPNIAAIGPGASTLAVSPSTVTADGTSAASITVTVRDGYGNPISGQTVTMSASGNSNTFSATSGTTNASGVFQTSLTSVLAQTEAVKATFGVALSQNVTFVAGAPSSSTSSLSASATSVTAGGSTNLTFTVRDAKGNPVSGQAVSLTCSGTGNTLGASSGTTNASGVFSTTLTSTKAEAKTVTATAGTMSVNTGVTFTPASASSTTSTLAVSASTVAAGASSSITVTVLDQYANVISGQAVTLTAPGTSTTLSPASGTTGADGKFTSTFSSTFPQTETLTAQVGGFNLTKTMTVTTGAPSTSTSTLAASPTSLAVGSSTTLTLTVKDAYGNAIANQAVTMTGSISGDTFGAATGTTSSSGGFTTTLTTTTSGTQTITATVGGTAINTSVTFNPGSPAASASSVSVASSVMVGKSTPITVLLKDSYGNAVPSQAVSVTVSGTTNTLSPASGTTDVNGNFVANLTSTKAEAKTITVTVTGFTLTGVVTFVPGPVSATNSSALASPTSLPADGVSVSTVSVNVTDSYGNPINGTTVQLTSTGSPTITQPAATDASGNASGTLKSTAAGTVTITVNAGGTQLAMQPTVTFNALVSCTKVVTGSLNKTSPFAAPVTVSYSMAGGGGGAGGGSGSWTAGGGGGSSAILAGGSLVTYAAGGAGGGGGFALQPGVAGQRQTGSFTLASGASLVVYVGGGGGAGGWDWGGGGGSGWYGGAGGQGSSGGGGAGGTNTGGVGAGGAGSGGAQLGGNGGGSSPGMGGNAGTGGAGGTSYDGGGGGGGFGGGGGACSNDSRYSPTAGGTNGASAASVNGAPGGLGANSWTASTTMPAAAGVGGSSQSGAGGNAGLVILTYTAASCSL